MAPDGTLAVLATTEADALRAYTVGPAAPAAGLAGLLAGASVGEAAITAVGPADFQSVWTENPDIGAPRVRSAEVRDGGLMGAR